MGIGDDGSTDASAVADGRGGVARAGAVLAEQLVLAERLDWEVERLRAQHATAEKAAAASEQRAKQAVAAAVARATEQQKHVIRLSAELSAAERESAAAAAAAAAAQRRMSTLAADSLAGRLAVDAGGGNAAGAEAAGAPGEKNNPDAAQPAEAAPEAGPVSSRAFPTLANAPLSEPTLETSAAASVLAVQHPRQAIATGPAAAVELAAAVDLALAREMATAAAAKGATAVAAVAGAGQKHPAPSAAPSAVVMSAAAARPFFRPPLPPDTAAKASAIAADASAANVQATAPDDPAAQAGAVKAEPGQQGEATAAHWPRPQDSDGRITPDWTGSGGLDDPICV